MGYYITKRRIAHQNDSFRWTIRYPDPALELGRFVLSPSLVEMSEAYRFEVLMAVSAQKKFNEDTDPDGHHSFGTVTIAGREVSWTIELYDPAYKRRSEAPDDLTRTRRLLTIGFTNDI